jgi:hypothetical protein
MSEDEPDIKRENLADSDESPFGDTTEHSGEQDTDEGETYHDPEGAGEDATDRRQPPGGEDGAQAASAGEGEGTEGVPRPDSERLANRTDT